MSEKFVTVGKFGLEYEAQLARSLLASEGIEAFLSGDQTGGVFVGPTILGGIIELQVHEEHAPRATGLLAAAAAGAPLDEDWETQAEEGAGVWVCSLCGSPISNLLSTCHACQTPRDAIRSNRPGDATSLQLAPDSRGTAESVQAREEITAAPAAPAPSRAPQTPPEDDKDDEPSPALTPGDELARGAFNTAVLALFFSPLVLYSLSQLWRLSFVDEELSPVGMRKFYGAMFVDGLVCLLWLALCMGVMYWEVGP